MVPQLVIMYDSIHIRPTPVNFQMWFHTVDPRLSGPQLSGLGNYSLHFGCVLIRNHLEFSSTIENALISVKRIFHLSG